MKFLVGFRKWSMAAAFLLIAVTLLISGTIPSETWLDNVSEVMVAFMATNIGEHIVNVSKEWINAKSNNM